MTSSFFPVKLGCAALAWLSLLVLSAALSEDPSLPANQLKSCYNRDFNWKPTLFNQFLRNEHCRLYLQSVLWSSKVVGHSPGSTAAAASHHGHQHGHGGQGISGAPIYPSPLTIFTTATLERLNTLEAQCRSWPGPLVASIWVPLMHTDEGSTELTPQAKAYLAQAEHQVHSLFIRMEAEATSCELKLLLFYELLGEEAATVLYPINCLRNAAMLAATTPLVAMVDVDLLISSTLAHDLMYRGGPPSSNAEARGRELIRACRERRAFVLPAFEPCAWAKFTLTQGIMVAEKSVRGGKHSLVQMVQGNKICYFQQNNYQVGHNSTLFHVWYKTSETYQVKYAPLYEPWYLADRFMYPWYDIRFRGYGWNKQINVATMALGANLTIMVHPSAYVVHRPHNLTTIRNMWCSAINSRNTPEKAQAAADLAANASRPDAKGSELSWRDRGQLVHRKGEELFTPAIKAMREGGHYSPEIDEPTARCLKELPWWDRSKLSLARRAQLMRVAGDA